MRWEWPGRWTGAACAVAGCMPMLFTLVAGTAGAAGAQAAVMMGPGMPVEPGSTPAWVLWLGGASWILLLASAALLVWSFWRTRPVVRAVAYVGVAGLVVNQTHMTPWLFFPAMALVAAAFALAHAGRRAAAAGTGTAA